MGSYDKEILKSTREVTRLEVQKRKLTRQLKAVKADLRRARRERKILIAKLTPPNVLPSRLFGDGVGTVVDRGKENRATTSELTCGDELVADAEPDKAAVDNYFGKEEKR